jgi:hypothetical protein
MNLNFGEVLTRAWQITWKFKVLWIFGVLASCARGGGGGSNSSYQVSGDGGTGPSNPPFEQLMQQLSQWLQANWWVIILLVLFAFLLMLVAVFLGTIGRIALIRGTLQAESGARSLSFGELFQGSLPYFWRIFGLSFLVGLAFFVVFAMLGLVGILTAGIGLVCIIPLVCLILPIAIVVNLILEQAYVAIVKENLGLVDGLRRGWEVLRINLGPIIVMAIILFVIAFVVTFVLSIPIILIVVPPLLAYVLNLTRELTPILVAGLMFLIYLPVLLLVDGIFNTFVQAGWTLTFLRLTAKPADTAPVIVEPNA